MDAFLKKIEQLADLASREPDPHAIDPALVMARINALPPETFDDGEAKEDAYTLKFFAGVGLAAAAAAIVVLVPAIGAWVDFTSPTATMEALMEVMESTL